MGYPLPHGRVVHINLADLGTTPFPELQRIASPLRGGQLMCITWSGVASNLEAICDELARIHDWLPDNTPPDGCYVLHVGMSASQQGQFHQSLREKQATAAILRDDQVLLIGDVPPVFEELASVIAATHNLTAEDVAALLPSYSAGYARTELGKMAHRRIVARRRKLGIIPQLPGIGKNRWHYYPLWSPCGPGETD